MSETPAEAIAAWNTRVTKQQHGGEVVERVARAIADTLHKCGKLKAGYDDPWNAGPCLVAARAALSALQSNVGE